jgi:dipeptidyl aminopeptidase/acylaminoacyl peptidase
MMRCVALLAAGASLLSFATAAYAVDPSLAADAKAFGTREATQLMDISPNGRSLLEVVSGPGRSSMLRIVDAASGNAKSLLRSDAKPETLYWCTFATDTQIICKYGAHLKMEGQIVGFSRLVTLTSDGKSLKELGQRSRFRDEGIRQFDGDILDWLPDQPGSVLMARNYVREVGTTGSKIADNRSGLGVDRIDLASLKIAAVEPAKDDISSYMTDGRGSVRLSEISTKATDSNVLTGLHRYRYRKTGSRTWDHLGQYNSIDGTGIYPLAVDATNDSVYLLEKTDGRDALYRMKLDGSGAKSLVAANKAVDISSVVRLGRGQRVIGYTFTDDRRRTVYFDPEFSKLAASLGKAIPGKPIITFEEASADGSTLLIFARGDKHAGSYYLFNKATKELTEVGVVRPNVEGRTLASVQSISVPAADGTRIPAYLTLPPAGTGKNLPAVVLPHGGPSARDEWGFDWLAQFLAARGYAVIQPNFRGSAGYGDQWMGENAFRNWRAAINDVSASARYLVSQGIADPKRLAIVGWSYGGYAALQSAAVEPSLYKAAVAVAPVTDLSLLRKEAEGFTHSELVKEMVGSGAQLTEGSPLRNAAAIKAPVLLVHGDMDANVGIAHSERMVAALKKAGGKAELMRFADLDHQLEDSDARVQMLTRMGEFLESSIGR